MSQKTKKSHLLGGRLAVSAIVVVALAALAPVVAAQASPPRPNEIVALSQGRGGALLHDFGRDYPSLSGGGERVVFTSSSSRLPDANDKAQVYVKDLMTEELRSLSVGFDGKPADQDVMSPVISNDGRYVAFVSEATNLVSGYDTHGVAQVYRVSVDTGVAEPVSAGAKMPVRGPVDISADGDEIVFSTADALTGEPGPYGVDQVFVRVMSFPGTILVSTKARTPGEYHSSRPSISPNGRYVAFLSSSANFLGKDSGVPQAWLFDLYDYWKGPQLVSKASDGTSGNASTSRVDVANTGAVAFESRATNLVPAVLNPRRDRVYYAPAATGAVSLVSHTATGDTRNAGGGSPVITADGDTVLYHSDTAELTTASAKGAQLYRYDVVRDQNVLVSKSAAGTPGDGTSMGVSVSADGRFAAYLSQSCNLMTGSSPVDSWKLLVQNLG